MIINLNASVDSPIYFELNDADEIVIVGDKKDELQRFYIGKKSSWHEINHPKRPQLCVNNCRNWHIIVNFRYTQDIVVLGLVAEVIKGCLKKGYPFDYNDENLHYVDRQIQNEYEIEQMRREFQERETECDGDEGPYID